MLFNYTVLNTIGERILNFFNPHLKYENRVTKDWLLMYPIHFFITLLSYFTFVTLSYLYKRHYISKCKRLQDKKRNNKSVIYPSKNGTYKFQMFLIKVIPIYNLIQVGFSLFIAILTIHEAKNRNFSIVYNAFDPTKENIAFCSWLFYINKVFDFFDTIFIILRGKWNQFTFLHTYHHLSVLFIMWINTSVGYDGDIYYVITINSIIHTIMYFYYFISSMKFAIPISLKSFVTYAQMVQFFSIIFPGFCILFLNFTCPYPRRIVALSFYYCVSLLVLFINFFIQAYILPKRKID